MKLATHSLFYASKNDFKRAEITDEKQKDE